MILFIMMTGSLKAHKKTEEQKKTEYVVIVNENITNGIRIEKSLWIEHALKNDIQHDYLFTIVDEDYYLISSDRNSSNAFKFFSKETLL